jgi:hypothetical protein
MSKTGAKKADMPIPVIHPQILRQIFKNELNNNNEGSVYFGPIGFDVSIINDDIFIHTVYFATHYARLTYHEKSVFDCFIEEICYEPNPKHLLVFRPHYKFYESIKRYELRKEIENRNID